MIGKSSLGRSTDVRISPTFYLLTMFAWREKDDLKGTTATVSKDESMNNVFNQILTRSKAFYDLAGETTREEKGCKKGTTNLNCFGKRMRHVER